MSSRSDLVRQLPASIRAGDEPVFAEPWQASAFAMAVALLEKGVFTWAEWSATLGDEIAHATEHAIAEDGSGYYQLWLRALERLVEEKNPGTLEELSRTTQAWRSAYEATPHGQPVTLAPKWLGKAQDHE